MLSGEGKKATYCYPPAAASARPEMTGLGEQLPGAEAERPRRVEFRRTAEARIMIEQARLLTLKTAWMMDHHGNKAARAEMAMIKVAAPNMARRVIDWAIQAFGRAAVTSDFTALCVQPDAMTRGPAARPMAPTRCRGTSSP